MLVVLCRSRLGTEAVRKSEFLLIFWHFPVQIKKESVRTVSCVWCMGSMAAASGEPMGPAQIFVAVEGEEKPVEALARPF